MKKDKKQIFSRGYQVSRERLAKNPYYTRSCFNCQYFYQASGDREEVCQNESVLEYDMVVSENEEFMDYKNKVKLLNMNISSIEDIVFMLSREVSRRTGDFKDDMRNYNVDNHGGRR